jgi:hypothetical protein
VVLQRLILLDHLNDPAGARINQDRSTIDDSIAILASTVFLRNVIIRHARFRKLGTHPYIALIAGGAVQLHNRKRGR